MKKERSFAVLLLVILAVNAVLFLGTNSASAATLDAYEPDNDHKEAKVLKNAEPQQHSIYPVGDADWLELRVDWEADVTIETDGPSGDTEMWLYRQDLTQITYDDDSGQGEFSKILNIHLTPAIYYIKICEYESNSEIQDYSIKASYPGLFQLKYGSSYNDEGYSVQQTPDGGYIVAGTYGRSTGYSDVYLIKTDERGTLQWQKTYGGAQNEIGRSVQLTTDGGFIIAGETGSYPWIDLYLVKTDSSGNMQWAKTYGGYSADSGYSVQQATDGGYVIAGWTESYGSGDVYLVKTDSGGNMQWEKHYGGPILDSGYSLQRTSDGGYVIAGYTRSYASGYSDVYLVKTDSGGNMQWQKNFDFSYWDCGRSVQQTSDGGYIIAGETNSYQGTSDVYVVKTDSGGNMQWQRTYGGTSGDSGQSVQRTTDGGYIIAGYTKLPNDVYLVKIDSGGNMQWEMNYGGPNNDRGYCVQQATDLGYIIAGWSASGSSDVYLIKTNPGGNSPSYTDVIVWEGTSLIPKIVYTILHDPCGDKSYSYLKMSETQSWEAALSLGVSSSVGVKAEAKFLGNGIAAEGSISISTSTTIAEAFVATYESSDASMQISEDRNYIGPGYGDKYIGEAWLFHYRIVDRTFLNGTTKRIMEYGPTRETGFFDSATWIKDHVQEPWRSKMFALNPAHDNYIDSTEQQKVAHLEQIHVTGGAPHEESYEVSGRKKANLSFSVRVDEALAISCGFEIIPGTKVGLTVEVKFSFDVGITLETSVEQSRKIGFVIEDDDGPDGFMIDVWYDQVFGTYLFTIDPTLTESSNPREYSDNLAPNKPPSPPSGPSSGNVGHSYDYSATTTDPDGDYMYYQFDWGDGSTTTTGLKAPSEAGLASHTWSSAGTKSVKARAKDSPCEIWGNWSDPKYVTIRSNGGGGGGCPTLFSWKGRGYKEESLLDIHNTEDVTVDYPLNCLRPVDSLCLLSLRELDNFTSHIDYVKLYAVDTNGDWHECGLILALHTQLGLVTDTLLCDDETKIELKPGERTELLFILPEDTTDIEHFVFELNGVNQKILI